MSREQREPTAEARALARTTRDYVDALALEGFTEEAALRFVAVMVGTMHRPPENPE